MTRRDVIFAAAEAEFAPPAPAHALRRLHAAIEGGEPFGERRVWLTIEGLVVAARHSIEAQAQVQGVGNALECLLRAERILRAVLQ